MKSLRTIVAMLALCVSVSSYARFVDPDDPSTFPVAERHQPKVRTELRCDAQETYVAEEERVCITDHNGVRKCKDALVVKARRECRRVKVLD